MHELVQRVAPALRASAAGSEAARQLAPEAMAALVDAGILRALLPAAYNGAELGPVHGCRLFEELATVDSAASWVGMISAAGAWLTILLPPEAADEMLGDPKAVINGSLFPSLAAVPVPGGHRVSGAYRVRQRLQPRHLARYPGGGDGKRRAEARPQRHPGDVDRAFPRGGSRDRRQLAHAGHARYG
jgi:hypothetical protein